MSRETSRRKFVASALLAGGAFALRGSAQEALPQVTLAVGGTAGTRVPVDWLGILAYRSRVETAGFFAPENIALVQQFRAMGPRGVLRFEGEGAALTARSLANLSGFLAATGWTCEMLTAGDDAAGKVPGVRSLVSAAEQVWPLPLFDRAVEAPGERKRVVHRLLSGAGTLAAALWQVGVALESVSAGFDGVYFAPFDLEVKASVLSPGGCAVKFLQAFAGCSVLPANVDVDAAKVRTFAAQRPDGKRLVAIVNAEAETAVRITAPFFDTVSVLTGAALDATEARVSTVVSETGSRRTAAGQSFTLPPHMATLLVLR